LFLLKVVLLRSLGGFFFFFPNSPFFPCRELILSFFSVFDGWTLIGFFLCCSPRFFCRFFRRRFQGLSSSGGVFLFFFLPLFEFLAWLSFITCCLYFPGPFSFFFFLPPRGSFFFGRPFFPFLAEEYPLIFPSPFAILVCSPPLFFCHHPSRSLLFVSRFLGPFIPVPPHVVFFKMNAPLFTPAMCETDHVSPVFAKLLLSFPRVPPLSRILGRISFVSCRTFLLYSNLRSFPGSGFCPFFYSQ